jgi:hypothetical protein
MKIQSRLLSWGGSTRFGVFLACLALFPFGSASFAAAQQPAQGNAQPPQSADKAAPSAAAAVAPANAAAPAPSTAAPTGTSKSVAPQTPQQKQLADDTARLLILANELKAELDKSNKDTLSLGVIRKAGEVEKLAHKVRDEMKASLPN